MRAVPHVRLLLRGHAVDQDRLDQTVQLDGVVPVLDAGQGVDIDLPDGPAEPDRVAQGLVELGGDGAAR
ncbi:hypothetical protein GCM10011578_096860 [Streptomyces fuscichromogenes]|uniref:Uncharacterized protein n=1 Tax=Streptomyces fuscichromogenes TaxID=1324013 RepID=A0A918CXH4_9ACTN|nr:hypothetical protein GCM10011578_096860 [Streptomyces fuscichromogenes]